MAKTYGTLPTADLNDKVTFSCNLPRGNSGVSSNGKIVVEKQCNWTDRTSNTPALLSSYSADSTYLLTEATQERLAAGLCKIVLTYSKDISDDTASGASVPATTYVEQTSRVEVSIKSHPKFRDGVNDWYLEWDFEKDDWDENGAFSAKQGKTSYITGVTTIIKTEYSTSKPTSARDDIGKLEEPGNEWTESGHYLLMASNRSKQGGFWAHQKEYQYSVDEWDSDFYAHV